MSHTAATTSLGSRIIDAAVAFGLAAAALAIVAWLYRYLDSYTLLAPILALLLAATLRGGWAGVLTTLLCGAGFLLPVPGTEPIDVEALRDGEWIRLGMFVAVGLAISRIVESLRRATAREREAVRALERRERQQAALAALGQLAMSSRPFADLVARAVALGRETVEADLAVVDLDDPAASAGTMSPGTVSVPIEGARSLVASPSAFRPFAFEDTRFLESIAAMLATDLRRRAADEALQRSERQLRTLADSIPQLAWMADGAGSVLWYNQRWYEYTGTDFEQTRGWGWKAVLHPDHLERVVEKLSRHFASGEPWEDTFPLRSATGEYRWFLSRALPIRDGEGRVVRWFGTNTDVTAQREAEAAVRTAEQRLRLALDATQMGTFDWVIASDQHYWDARTRAIFGVGPDEPITTALLRNAIHPDDRARAQQAIEGLLAAPEGLATFAVDYRVVRPDGDTRYVEVRGRLAYGEEGADRRPSSLVGTVRDVTEIRTIEEQLRQTQKLESIGVLAGGIAHDFNNLLTGILGYASLAIRSLPPESRSRTEPLLQEVIGAGQRAADLTRQLLAYAGKGRFHIERIDLRQHILEMRALVHASIPRLVELRLDLPEVCLLVDADRAQLQQLMMNLILNGAEAIGDHSGVVEVRVRPEHLSAETIDARFPEFAITPGDFVRIEVRDTGSGMDDDTRARMFDPFFSTKFTGRGLGLAAVIGIVKGHNGALEVESQLGQGTTFRVWLPVAARAVESLADSPRGAAVRGRGTVLVVEDEPELLRLAERVLSSYGYAVLAAENGRQAVDRVRENEGAIDLVVLDLVMPVMSGEEAAGQIRAIRQDLPIVVTSGYGDIEATRRLGDAHVDEFLPKPYTAEDLAIVVDRVLQRLSER